MQDDVLAARSGAWAVPLLEFVYWKRRLMNQLGLFGTVGPILVINPVGEWATCVVCERDTPLGFGLAMYEGLIVADDYAGEWGGAPCCKLCYEINRGHVGVPIEPLYGLTPLRLLPRGDSNG